MLDNVYNAKILDYAGNIERIGPIAFGFKLLDVTLTRDTP